MSSSEVNGNDMSESVEVNGNKIWYEKIGCGPNVVLLIPGPIGTARTDFSELLDSEDELDFDKFTAIAVEPIGNGRSRPPQRNYNVKVYQNDCDIYSKLMQNLNYDKYSVIGWSEGAKVALLMAIKCRDSIESLILVSATNSVTNKSLNVLQSKKSIDSFPKDRLRAYIDCYKTKEEVQKVWTRYIKFVEFYNQYFPNDIFEDKYYMASCPVLLVHGDKDQTIESDTPLKICRRLQSARIHRFPNGDNDCHQKYSSMFKTLVEDHIINRENYISKFEALKIEGMEEILYKSFQ